MPPRSRPFFPESNADQNMNPDNEYIDSQIQAQVQAQLQAQFQAQVQSEVQSQLQSQFQAFSQAQAQAEPQSHSQLQEPTPTFMSNMNLFFWASPELFAMDRSKILFIGTRLLGTASTWFGSLVAINSSSLESYPEFLAEFRNNFSDPSHNIKVRGLIRNCKQGTRSVDTYVTEFRSLARESGFDDTALVDQFLRGLSTRIMQYLMVSDLPESLEENIQIAVRVDNRLATVLSMSDNQPHVKSQNPLGM
ncbi:Retrotransposon-derived protein PEG10 [Smittium culicis]|uniref:Retrotransposon-derived protein PEG10 n=1 Tax=Smittium culicis TaxID=133412 RepID=A0A1R1YPX9_9FUNG|nr:Retrotransposon-derived protein PEG10 [Smittium culicis]